MSMFDASSIIHGWDTYPINQFPGLWTWLASQINANQVAISATAYEEVRLKSPDRSNWLRAQDVTVEPITAAILQQAITIKASLGIVTDNYHQDSVGENDIFIIASARECGATLISDEKRQPILPTDRRRYKIPAVCTSLNIPVQCQYFLEYIVASGERFG